MSHSGTERSYVAAAGPSTERGKKLCDGVYSLHEPGGRPEVELIFIHGLQLHDSKDAYKDAYWTTWLARDGSEDICWPMTWLAAKVPKARVLSISYDAILALKSSTSRTMDLYPLGETLVQEMVLSGIGIGQNGCPVVFVCHCLGGLIIKQIIIMAHIQFEQDLKCRRLLRNTKVFVFYATPHGGSDMINMSYEIGRLNSQFEKIRSEEYNNMWKVRVIAETHATFYNRFFSSVFVEEQSARHVYHTIVHVGADHFDVCKPNSVRETPTSYI